eukprot:SAG25_NODE_7990_length_447_cov_0.718391_1_plen_88_part_10
MYGVSHTHVPLSDTPSSTPSGPGYDAYVDTGTSDELSHRHFSMVLFQMIHVPVRHLAVRMAFVAVELVPLEDVLLMSHLQRLEPPYAP